MLYEDLGGMEGCRKLSTAFYTRAGHDPVLHPFFPGKSHRCAIDAFTLFLAQFLGGPYEYGEQRWWVSLRESHLRFKIGAAERTAWMSNMRAALREVGATEPVSIALCGLFETASAAMVDRCGAPAAAAVHPELATHWTRDCAFDAAAGAIRAGDMARAIALAREIPIESDRSATLMLLERMIASGDPALLEYVRETLLRNPALAHDGYAHGTFLHGAAAAGCLAAIELLLQLGADPNAVNSGGHDPLYCAGNGCLTGGGDVVRALVRAGADVNAHGGVMRCTPLHMAARRGNVEIAEALLDCGADIAARDRRGDTPLARAVKCRKVGVADLLRARGAR